jgi:hypothetical protein
VTDPRAIDDQVAHVAERLVRDFAGEVPDGVVQTMVTEVYGQLREARVTQFVPVLVDRSVRRQLRSSVRRLA